MRDRTGASQWEFPTEEDKEGDPVDAPSTQTLSQEEIKTSGSAGGATGQSDSTISSPVDFSFPVRHQKNINLCKV